MRATLPSRFITLGADERIDAGRLIAAFQGAPNGHVAMEMDAPAVAAPAAQWAVEAASGLGIEVTARLRPADHLDHRVVARLRARSCSSISVGLDGHDAITHDAYHGVHGGFASSVGALERARHLGFDLYVLSTIHRADVGHLERMSSLPRWLNAKAWFVSFASEPGIHGSAQPLDLTERRQACAWLHDIAERHAQAIAVRCPECGASEWMSCDVCVDPAEIAASPCMSACSMRPSTVSEDSEQLASTAF